jgi:hypothetical protein
MIFGSVLRRSATVIQEVKEARVTVCWVDVMSKWKKVVEDLSDPDTAPPAPSSAYERRSVFDHARKDECGEFPSGLEHWVGSCHYVIKVLT